VASLQVSVQMVPAGVQLVVAGLQVSVQMVPAGVQLVVAGLQVSVQMVPAGVQVVVAGLQVSVQMVPAGVQGELWHWHRRLLCHNVYVVWSQRSADDQAADVDGLWSADAVLWSLPRRCRPRLC